MATAELKSNQRLVSRDDFYRLLDSGGPLLPAPRLLQSSEPLVLRLIDQYSGNTRPSLRFASKPSTAAGIVS